MSFQLRKHPLKKAKSNLPPDLKIEPHQYDYPPCKGNIISILGAGNSCIQGYMRLGKKYYHLNPHLRPDVLTFDQLFDMCLNINKSKVLSQTFPLIFPFSIADSYGIECVKLTKNDNILTYYETGNKYLISEEHMLLIRLTSDVDTLVIEAIVFDNIILIIPYKYVLRRCDDISQNTTLYSETGVYNS